MKLEFNRDDLLKPLTHVCSVVERRQSSPILSNLLVKVAGQQLTMLGTDLEVEMIAKSQVNADAEGEFTIPARKFFDICRALPDGAKLTVQVDNDKAVIRSGRSRYTLATLPSNEFPQSEDISSECEISLTQTKLKQLIEQTQFSMAQQDVRYYLNGLLLDITADTLRSVATDGHRLALAEISETTQLDDPVQIIVPRKGVAELLKLLEDSDQLAVLNIGSNHIKVTLPDIVFTSKLIEGKFPDYNQVLPAGNTSELVVSRETLRSAFQRASVLSNEKYRGMRLSLATNLLKATIHNPEQEEAEEEIEVQYSADEFEIGFNVAYFLDVLNNLKTDEVSIMFKDANSSCLITGVGEDVSKYVIMPMRL